MKFPSPPVSSRSGAALVIVLAILVLVAGLIVAFLSLAKTERKSAAVYLSGAGVRQMADSAIGIVQTQINLATTRGSTVAWASQPGMVRTYKTDGALDTAYKLYSAASLAESDPAKIGSDPAINDDIPPSTWAASPSIWTDLNAPVAASGQNVYPIIDPGILDLPVAQQPLGFSVTNAPGGTTNQRAPMPVRWLYVLQNGQVVAPTGSGSTAIVAGASGTNPITGRIAFWTDDESSKVNLNTAGVGGFWDTPHFYTTEDRKFASSQPLNGEFQRYPGHPATTSLSAVFPQLPDDQILSTITPRYQSGGSKQGVVDTYQMTAALNSGTLASGPLYADADEIIFQPSHTARSMNAVLTNTTVARANFFLTTASQVPELNLFGYPRVACWPISTNPNGRTTFDKVIAFASSLNGNPYYFQRQSALSPSIDAGITRNQQLFSYLQYLTSQKVPGFGVDLATKFGSDRDQILTEIWDYIRSTNLFDTRLTGNQFTADANNSGSGYGYVVPLENGSSRGFGRSITLSELAFVFICTADPVDTQNATPNANGMLGSNDASSNRTLMSTALTPTQRRVQMMIVPEFFSPSQGNINIRPKYVRLSISGLNGLTLGGQPLFIASSGTLKIDDVNFNTGWHRRFLGGTFDHRALLRGISDPGILDTASPKYPFISNYLTVTVPNPGSANPGTMDFAASTLTVTVETSVNGSTWITAQTIPITPPTSAIPIPNLVRKGTVVSAGSSTPATDAKYWWGFSSSAPFAGVTGGRLASLANETGYFQVSGGVPVQAYTNSAFAGSLFREAEDANYYTDVVRSMVVSHGDMRLVCGLKTVPGNAFASLGDWSSSGAANALMHNLTVGAQNGGALAAGSQFRRHFITTNAIGPNSVPGIGGYGAPDFSNKTSAPILNAVSLSGDFDNGTAYWPDGAFINKPDEGTIYGTATAIPYFDSTEQESLLSTGFFSPNRIMPGPGMFGSLPTHIKRYAADSAQAQSYAWRTLLFRKQPSHPDSVNAPASGIPPSAPDHLLMDLFWMPTVEPYAISEPFASAGKVNMNYQIQPFTYIQRKTGLYAVLQREKIAAIDNTASAAAQYKSSADASHPQSGAAAVASYRLGLDVDATLQQFDTRFADSSARLFLSPTELCDLWLVPQGQSLSGMANFWTAHALTGDNLRERPYATIIPRLTTKSNTFTVHYRVQTLRLPKGLDPATWDEAKGAVTGEYRGATTIQRFVDLNNQNLLGTDFAVNTASQPTVDTFYRWRVISAKQFAP